MGFDGNSKDDGEIKKEGRGGGEVVAKLASRCSRLRTGQRGARVFARGAAVMGELGRRVK